MEKADGVHCAASDDELFEHVLFDEVRHFHQSLAHFYDGLVFEGYCFACYGGEKFDPVVHKHLDFVKPRVNLLFKSTLEDRKLFYISLKFCVKLLFCHNWN